MESPESVTTAENVAAWFAGSSAPQASAHYEIDSNSIVQSVRDMDVAWHAPGANHNGIGLEHAGYARQTREQWLDDFGLKMLALSAELSAGLITKYEIPLRHLTVDQLKASQRGFIGHIDATNAFSGGSGHTDPGPTFPWVVYLEMVKHAMAKALEPPAPAPHWKWAWLRWIEGEGEYRKYGPRKGPRPKDAPARISPGIWAWRLAFLARRKLLV